MDVVTLGHVTERPAISSLLPVGAAAAVLGGIVWSVKGLLVMSAGVDVVAGVDLGTAFVALQGLFALAVLGLSELVVARAHPDDVVPGGRRNAIGRGASWIALALSVVLAAWWVFRGDIGDHSAIAFAALACSLAWIAGAGLVGVSALRRDALAGPFRWVPLAVGLGAIPLFLVFGLASNFLGERLLEVPVLAIGLLWVALGVSLIRGEAIPAR